ncbi:MAG: class I SAM-dependent methyltransferase [Candidatus Dormibacteria bacterium]
MDLEGVKKNQQTVWSTGDFSRIGALNTIVSEGLCEDMGLLGGRSLLDVAAGSGSLSLAAARRFLRVTCTDYVPALLEQARRRAEVDFLEMEFAQADAENLPFPDGSFDYVGSQYGAMFAPDQERTAGELMRVVRPGGVLGMANWTPSGLAGQLFALGARYAPPPPGLRPATDWGTGRRIGELLGPHAANIRVVDRSFRQKFPTFESFLDIFTTWFGPMVSLKARLEPEQWNAYVSDLRDLVDSINLATDGSVDMPGNYLNVIAVKRG